jgi:3-oxoacyl-[acyl-carrier protein] reductase
MNIGLKAKTALVQGAGGGLGSAIAQALAAEGAKVAAAGRTLTNVKTTVDAIEADGGTAMALDLDLSDLNAFPPALEQVRERFGDIEVLINNSGGPPPSTAAGVSPEQWLEQFTAMVLGVIHLTDLVVPGMRERGWGRIITSTSSGAVAPIPNLGISNTLRSSLHGWSKTLARELAPDGITVNVVVPGRIGTQRINQLDAARAEREGKSVEEVKRASAATSPVRRYGRPEEYAAAVVFLASEPASYITGSILRVDGGLIPAI